MGKPSGSRRLTHEPDNAEKTVGPLRPARLPRPSPPGPSDEDAEKASADERTSPFPYAEKFDEWVTDETDTDGRQDRRHEI